MTKLPIFLLLSLSVGHAPMEAQAESTAQTEHRCAADAIKQAMALLVFHSGADTNVGVEQTAKQLPPLRNPVDRRQWFDVLEVQGYVYRAEYQMRLIYARVPGKCALMGQEIIELSRL